MILERILFLMVFRFIIMQSFAYLSWDSARNSALFLTRKIISYFLGLRVFCFRLVVPFSGSQRAHTSRSDYEAFEIHKLYLIPLKFLFLAGGERERDIDGVLCFLFFARGDLLKTIYE